MKKVDDAMGVVYTHGLAGLCGGLLVGLFADPAMIVYQNSNGAPISFKGWIYGNRHQFFIQFFAAVTIIVYDALMTFIILKVISFFTPLRMPDDELEIGDLAVHDEEAYPSDEGAERVLAGSSASSFSEPVTGTPLAGEPS
jgi:Amt family ammonium transporter